MRYGARIAIVLLSIAVLAAHDGALAAIALLLCVVWVLLLTALLERT